MTLRISPGFCTAHDDSETTKTTTERCGFEADRAAGKRCVRLFRMRGDEGPQAKVEVEIARVFTLDRCIGVVWRLQLRFFIPFSFISQTEDAMRRGEETRGLTSSVLSM